MSDDATHEETMILGLTSEEKVILLEELVQRRRYYRRSLFALAVSIIFMVFALAGIGLLLDKVYEAVHLSHSEKAAVLSHRIRNEEAHAALCAKMDVLQREMDSIIFRFGIDPLRLTDENGKPIRDSAGNAIDANGQPVKCPAPLTKQEILQGEGADG